MASSGRRPPQTGVTLVVILLFMAAVAVGGLFSARSALMGEQLARNQLDMQVARQAAEAALRDAEKDLMLVGGLPSGALCDRGATRPVLYAIASGFRANCLAGQCQETKPTTVQAANYATAGKSGAPAGEPWWPTARGGLWNNAVATKPSSENDSACSTFTGAVPLGTFTGTRPIAGVAQQPEYLIEVIQRSETFFRITARGFGMRPGAEVVMQSYFTVPEL
jgi:type IV pilus assembly protein PilX